MPEHRMPRDDRFDIAAAVGDGLMFASVLRDLGVHPTDVEREARAGRIARVRTGVYADAAAWTSLSSDARYRHLVRATAGAARAPVVVSHLSAAAMHRMPLIGRWPDVVSVAMPGRGGGRRTAHVSVRRAGTPFEPVVIDGVRCSGLLRTLVDIATTEPLTTSVPMLDAAIARTRGTRSAVDSTELSAELDALGPGRSRALARLAIALADGASGSPGESFSRVRMHQLGFARPELQVSFPNVSGSFALVDFYWRSIRLIGEFDGRMKYTRSRRLSGLDPADVVFREKRREDELRRRGENVVRWDWAVVRSPRAFSSLLTAAGVPARG